MARQQKTSKGKSKEISKQNPKGDEVSVLPQGISIATIAKEFAGVFGNQCSTKLDVGFIAAEMLLHIGRGQMAAQLGVNFDHLSNSDLTTIKSETGIFEFPGNPNQKSVVEKLFLGFVTSIANHDPVLRRQRWKTNGNSDLPFIAALSFLVGNLAWQKHTTGSPMTRDNVKDAFEDVSSVHCPAATPTAGGGPFCDWMDL